MTVNVAAAYTKCALQIRKGQFIATWDPHLQRILLSCGGWVRCSSVAVKVQNMINLAKLLVVLSVASGNPRSTLGDKKFENALVRKDVDGFLYLLFLPPAEKDLCFESLSTLLFLHQLVHQCFDYSFHSLVSVSVKGLLLDLMYFRYGL